MYRKTERNSNDIYPGLLEYKRGALRVTVQLIEIHFHTLGQTRVEYTCCSQGVGHLPSVKNRQAAVRVMHKLATFPFLAMTRYRSKHRFVGAFVGAFRRVS